MSCVFFDGGVQRTISEADIVRYLIDASLIKRDETLEQLRIQISSGSHSFVNPVSVFCGIAAALTDEAWVTRYQCVKLVHELIPLLGPINVDRCVQIALRPLVRCLGDPKMTVGTAAAEALDVYSDHTGDFRRLLESVSHFVVLSASPSTKKTTLKNVSFLLDVKNKNGDFQTLVTALIKLLSNESCFDFHPAIVDSLDKISRLVGDDRFQSYLDITLPHHRQRYCKLAMKNNTESTVNLHVSCTIF